MHYFFVELKLQYRALYLIYLVTPNFSIIGNRLALKKVF